ncbi:MAG: hypothetical protein V3576_02065 [Candidatus Cloacimonadota bacterium]
MTKKIFYMLLVLVLAVLPACNKDRKKLPNDDIAKAITEFDPIPSIQIVTTKLEVINPAKILAVMPQTALVPETQDQRRIYALGVLQADLMLTAITGNGAALNRFFDEYVDLATALEIEKQADEVKSSMQELLRAGDWAEISTACSQLKQKYEASTWESAQYETYTLFLLGQWVEISRLYSAIQATEETEDIGDNPFEAGLWSTIHKDLQLLTTESLTSSTWFQTAYNEVAKLAELTDSPTGFVYNAESLAQIGAMTSLINSIVFKELQ